MAITQGKKMTPLPLVSAQTAIDIERSCNCCWGKPRKQKKEIKDLISEMQKPRDSQEVYNFTVNIQPKEKQ